MRAFGGTTKASVVLIATGATAGCGYSINSIPQTETPENIESVTPAVVSRASPPAGSQRLGKIDARKCWYGGVAACHERLGAEAAARFGANYVQLVDDGSRVTWCAWSAPRCEGVAYRSAALQPATGVSTEVRAPRVVPDVDKSCTKDTDCDGDLICLDDRCSAPGRKGK